MLNGLKRWAQGVRRDAIALYLAVRDPRTPWYAKAIAAVVVAYALSPIDLVPDFIPILGYLDDILIVPAGLWIAIRLVPAHVIHECRARAAQLAQKPNGRAAAVAIVAIWITVAVLAGWCILDAFLRRPWN
ncbi:MAG: YkvA family protein [Roseibium sp.]